MLRILKYFGTVAVAFCAVCFSCAVAESQTTATSNKLLTNILEGNTNLKGVERYPASCLSDDIKRLAEIEFVKSKILYPNLIPNKDWIEKFKCVPVKYKKLSARINAYLRSSNEILDPKISAEIKLSQYIYMEDIPYCFYSIHFRSLGNEIEWTNLENGQSSGVGMNSHVAFIYDDDFTVGVPKFSYSDSNHNYVSLPLLFFGKDYKQCEESKNILAELAQSLTRKAGCTDDSCWVLPYVFLLSEGVYIDVTDLHFVKATPENYYLKFIDNRWKIGYNIIMDRRNKSLSYSPIESQQYAQEMVYSKYLSEFGTHTQPGPIITFQEFKDGVYYFLITENSNTYNCTYKSGQIEIIKK